MFQFNAEDLIRTSRTLKEPNTEIKVSNFLQNQNLRESPSEIVQLWVLLRRTVLFRRFCWSGPPQSWAAVGLTSSRGAMETVLDRKRFLQSVDSDQNADRLIKLLILTWGSRRAVGSDCRV